MFSAPPTARQLLSGPTCTQEWSVPSEGRGREGPCPVASSDRRAQFSERHQASRWPGQPGSNPLLCPPVTQHPPPPPRTAGASAGWGRDGHGTQMLPSPGMRTRGTDSPGPGPQHACPPRPAHSRERRPCHLSGRSWRCPAGQRNKPEVAGSEHTGLSRELGHYSPGSSVRQTWA